MDLRQLETFCKVADLGGFSRAGEAVYLTQPTVSGHIASLERTLGLKLFDRLGRKVDLTTAGRIFYRYAKEILRLRDESFNALYEFSSLIKGKITIGGSTIPGEYFLPKVMGNFQKEAPGISISLLIADSQKIVALLLAGEVEVGVVGMKFDGERVESYPLFKDRVIIISHPHLPFAQKGKVSWEELKTVPMLIRERGSGTRKAFEEYLTAAGYRLDQFSIIGEVGSSTAVKEGVKAQIGLGFISDIAVKEELEIGKIKKIMIDGPELPERNFFVVVSKDRDLSPPARHFMEFLKQWGPSSL
jgi:DNA-binding transcriptional LysR family regulator